MKTEEVEAECPEEECECEPPCSDDWAERVKKKWNSNGGEGHLGNVAACGGERLPVGIP